MSVIPFPGSENNENNTNSAKGSPLPSQPVTEEEAARQWRKRRIDAFFEDTDTPQSRPVAEKNSAQARPSAAQRSENPAPKTRKPQETIVFASGTDSADSIRRSRMVEAFSGKSSGADFQDDLSDLSDLSPEERESVERRRRLVDSFAGGGLFDEITPAAAKPIRHSSAVEFNGRNVPETPAAEKKKKKSPQSAAPRDGASVFDSIPTRRGSAPVNAPAEQPAPVRETAAEETPAADKPAAEKPAKEIAPVPQEVLSEAEAAFDRASTPYWEELQQTAQVSIPPEKHSSWVIDRLAESADEPVYEEQPETPQEQAFSPLIDSIAHEMAYAVQELPEEQPEEAEEAEEIAPQPAEEQQEEVCPRRTVSPVINIITEELCQEEAGQSVRVSPLIASLAQEMEQAEEEQEEPAEEEAVAESCAEEPLPYLGAPRRRFAEEEYFAAEEVFRTAEEQAEAEEEPQEEESHASESLPYLGAPRPFAEQQSAAVYAEEDAEEEEYCEDEEYSDDEEEYIDEEEYEEEYDDDVDEEYADDEEYEDSDEEYVGEEYSDDEEEYEEEDIDEEYEEPAPLSSRRVRREARRAARRAAESEEDLLSGLLGLGSRFLRRSDDDYVTEGAAVFDDEEQPDDDRVIQADGGYIGSRSFARQPVSGMVRSHASESAREFIGQRAREQQPAEQPQHRRVPRPAFTQKWHAPTGRAANRGMSREELKLYKDGKRPLLARIRRLLIAVAAVVVLLIGCYYLLAGVMLRDINNVKVEKWLDKPAEQVSSIPISNEPYVTNILLLGIDDDGSAGSRSDTMIIASVNTRTNSVKLCSVLRDSYVSIPGHKYNKINAAYAQGGAELAMKTIESNLRVKLDHYVSTDMSSMIAVVEAVGGVTIELTEAEAEQVNLHSRSPYTAYAGVQRLDGRQAVQYAQIRKIDNDFSRTNRQRVLLDAIVKQCRTLSPAELLNVVETVAPRLTTDMSSTAIATTALKVLPALSNGMEQMVVPAEGTYEFVTINGASCIEFDLQQNVRLLKEFLYEKE
ncbi:MAG: hypothetical protein E7559_06755 [Ruminococcaceae bacterium]|nr:hypothetical protein [Oscillospiraceae bacterium]